MNSIELAHTVVEALEDKKGEDILLLDLEKLSMFTSYFVISTGTSDRMLDALSDAVIEKVREKFGIKGISQGHASSGWVVIDFGSVIVHCFAPETREFYRLEDLWREGKVLLRLQ